VYWIYASAIFLLATVALVFSIIQTRANNASLQRMAKHHAQVTVIRAAKAVVIDSTELVPGDVVSLADETNQTLACDMILLQGECVVNESSLTGESVPVIKTSIPSGAGYVFLFIYVDFGCRRFVFSVQSACSPCSFLWYQFEESQGLSPRFGCSNRISHGKGGNDSTNFISQDSSLPILS
jgi:magnesium-transporting ATPase (P-type)